VTQKISLKLSAGGEVVMMVIRKGRLVAPSSIEKKYVLIGTTTTNADASMSYYIPSYGSWEEAF